MKYKEIFLSKWFYYSLVGLLLISFILVLHYSYFLPIGNWFSEEVRVNLFCEFLGSLITFVLFIIVFDLRERLEWKSVEGKVKRKMGRQILGLLLDLSELCEVKGISKDWISGAGTMLGTLLLDKLLSGEIKLNNEAKKGILEGRVNISLLETRAIYLGDIETKYEKFLDSNLQSSLIEIQESLHRLSMLLKNMKSVDSAQYQEKYGLKFSVTEREEFCLAIVSNLIKRILVEINLIQQKVDLFSIGWSNDMLETIFMRYI